MTLPDLHIGTSGWSYQHWENVLYPAGLPVRDRLGHYSSSFATTELNASFYRWPKATTFSGWRRRLPPGFRLSVKAPRGLTHAKRLYAPEVWADRIAACWHELGERRGVLLVQLPPTMSRDDARLDYFLGRLQSWIPVAVEFRHPSWIDDRVFEVLAPGADAAVTSRHQYGFAPSRHGAKPHSWREVTRVSPRSGRFSPSRSGPAGSSGSPSRAAPGR